MEFWSVSRQLNPRNIDPLKGEFIYYLMFVRDYDEARIRGEELLGQNGGEESIYREVVPLENVSDEKVKDSEHVRDSE